VKQSFVDWCRLPGGQRMQLPPMGPDPVTGKTIRPIICRHWLKVSEENLSLFP
jgi:hypothetical protein